MRREERLHLHVRRLITSAASDPFPASAAAGRFPSLSGHSFVMNQSDELPSDLESYYRGLAAKPATTIRFFEHRDAFCVFAEDAEFIARDLRKTAEGLKESTSALVFLKVNDHQFAAEVREILLERQYRVQVHNKDDGGKWQQDYECSPGNWGPLDEILYSARSNLEARGLAAVCHSDVRFAVVYADTIENLIRITYFTDDVNLCTLESVLVQLAPKEVIFPRGCKLEEQISEKLVMNQVLRTPVTRAEYFIRDDVIATAQFLLTENVKLEETVSQLDSIPEQERNLVKEALAAVVKFLDLKSCSYGRFQMSFMDLPQYMKLDAAAVNALNLFSMDRGKRIENSKDTRSIFSLLNKCRTQSGQRLLSQWVRQPLADIRKITARHSLVQYFVDNAETRATVRDQRLRGIPDLVRLSCKLQQKAATLQEFHSVYCMIKYLPQLVADMGGQDHPSVKTEFADRISFLLQQVAGEGMLTDMVDMLLDWKRLAETREFHISSCASDALVKVNAEWNQMKRHAEHLYRSAQKDLLLTERQMKLTDDEKGFSFYATHVNEKNLRNQEKYFIPTKGTKSGFTFTCEELDQLNIDYMRTQQELRECEAAVLSEAQAAAAGFAVPIRQISDVISQLDVVVSLAEAASGIKSYVRPEMLEMGSGILSLTGLRHPVVEVRDNNFIANDVHLTDKGQKFKLVTGPNMGGKSTYIRSAAVAILMAQMGSFVAADEAKITVMDGIFSRVGASDRQLRGNSTFMGEMVETAAILRSATANSFIAIDELGRGTSTFDGYGIAYAVCKSIARDLKSFCLFATHFHELTELESEEPGIGNLHMAVSEEAGDGNSLLLLFKVLTGVSTRSYGINTAIAAAFPPELISIAENKLSELDQGLCDMDAVSRLVRDVDPDDEEQIRKLVSDLKKLRDRSSE